MGQQAQQEQAKDPDPRPDPARLSQGSEQIQPRDLRVSLELPTSTLNQLPAGLGLGEEGVLRLLWLVAWPHGGGSGNVEVRVGKTVDSPLNVYTSTKRSDHMPEVYVYILASLGRTLYIGKTNDLTVRVSEHKEKRYPQSFTAKYNVNRLVYFEVFEDPHEAARRERQLKGWRRARKIALIESINPEWRDLSHDLD